MSHCLTVSQSVTKMELELTKMSSLKGPVSGFDGSIPLPSLESRINRNHLMGANLIFLFGFCLT